MRIKVSEEDVKRFDESDVGKRKNSYLKRSTIIGIILITAGLIFLIIDIFNKSDIYNMIISIIVLSFGIYFVINSRIIKKKEVNKYIYEQKHKTSKK